MTHVLRWRQMTCGLACWSGYVVLWTVTVDAGAAPAILWWSTGVVVFGGLWLAMRHHSAGGASVRP